MKSGQRHIAHCSTDCQDASYMERERGRGQCGNTQVCVHLLDITSKNASKSIPIYSLKLNAKAD